MTRTMTSRSPNPEDTALPPWITPPPSVDELMTSDGEPMETQRHVLNASLLVEVLRLHYGDRDDVFVGSNMFVYFSPHQLKTHDYRGPDVFAVIGGIAEGHRTRKAWVAWEEHSRLPDLVIELTSPTTERVDRTIKKDIYEGVVRAGDYFMYSPFTFELEGYRLVEGVYERIEPNEHGHLASHETGLALGVDRTTTYSCAEGPWLRLYTPDGELVPTVGEQERARADALAAELAALRSQLADE